MSFKNVKSMADAAEYIAGLNERWPERSEVMDLVLAEVRQQSAPEARVLELCCGAGVLGAHLLNGAPTILYTGIDQSQPLLDAAEETLAGVAPRVTLWRHDLNADGWHDVLLEADYRFDAIVSMQSLHDLGGEAEVSRIYELAQALLHTTGIFINADLIVEHGAALPNNPGRLTVDRHLELLAQYGYRDVSCIAQLGGFGVVTGRRN